MSGNKALTKKQEEFNKSLDNNLEEQQTYIDGRLKCTRSKSFTNS